MRRDFLLLSKRMTPGCTSTANTLVNTIESQSSTQRQVSSSKFVKPQTRSSSVGGSLASEFLEAASCCSFAGRVSESQRAPALATRSTGLQSGFGPDPRPHATLFSWWQARNEGTERRAPAGEHRGTGDLSCSLHGPAQSVCPLPVAGRGSHRVKSDRRVAGSRRWFCQERPDGSKTELESLVSTVVERGFQLSADPPERRSGLHLIPSRCFGRDEHTCEQRF